LGATCLQNQAAGDLAALIEPSPDVIRQRSTSRFTAEEFYQTLQSRGLHYGPSFRGIQHIWSNDRESLGFISLPESLQYDSDVYQIHPVLLDACLQVLAAAINSSSGHNLYIPTGCKRIRLFSRPDRHIWSHVSLQSEPASNKDVINADIRLIDENNQIVSELIGFQLQRTSRRIRRLLSRQDTWLYHVRWQTREEPKTLLGIQERRHWLIFADDEGLAEELAKQLEAGGDSCQLLLCEEAIKNLDNADEGALLKIIEKHLQETHSPLYGIIHLWSLSIPKPSSDVLESTDIMQMLGCNSVLLIVQALARRMAGMPRLWLVTRGAQSVKAGEPIAVEQSALWGFGKVISFEFPDLKCIRIDLDLQQSIAETLPHLIKQISIDDREDQIAFRAGVHFVLRLLPFTITASFIIPVSLQADSTYLITGGTGGLGLKIAEWMAQQGARHLVLLSRSEPSPLAISMVDQMRHEGIEVVYARADVSDPAQLRIVFDNIERSMPVLRGVIHAAGVLDDGSLLNINTERMKKVMAPKVDGTWNLHNITLHLHLDFFVLFSSAVSVLGSPGQGNYAAASSYLDAMAHYRRNLGLPAISINWGPWAEVGLAAEATEKLQERNASNQHLIKVIKIDQGLEILEQLLTEPTPQIIVLPFDLKNLLELYRTAAGIPFFAEVGGSDTHVTRLYTRPNLRQEYVAPRNEIERKLAELWRQTLHIDRVGVHDSFFELGGDSVLAAQILSLAQKAFGIRINPQEAFKAFTMERLAEMLEAEILSKIEGMSEDEAQRQLSKRN
jgi:acyl transferase domain-containing protein/acyl carrier protein